MKSARSKATDITHNVRIEVAQRDGRRCIVCGKMDSLQCAHYIPRSQGGLGIPENLGMLCIYCHNDLDNGNKPKVTRIIKERFREYLKHRYIGWNERMLVYSKYTKGK